MLAQVLYRHVTSFLMMSLAFFFLLLAYFFSKQTCFIMARNINIRYGNGQLSSTAITNICIYISAAMWGPAAMLGCLASTECDWRAAVTILCVALFCNGAISACSAVNHTDIAPNYAGNSLLAIKGHILPSISIQNYVISFSEFIHHNSSLYNRRVQSGARNQVTQRRTVILEFVRITNLINEHTPLLSLIISSSSFSIIYIPLMAIEAR